VAQKLRQRVVHEGSQVLSVSAIRRLPLFAGLRVSTPHRTVRLTEIGPWSRQHIEQLRLAVVVVDEDIAFLPLSSASTLS